ncbi:MAG: pyridine nucleotide-disulfide oxidoreductase [Betaproteobacteria bacterium RIFCSPLOWO2_02_FULL_62_17]|nr:MAG: pyridine nucleotide-disulfide oxidoreductase [Betaproteobacteria bacterium RIFCSPLOWO2_02_FULL_62_17]
MLKLSFGLSFPDLYDRDGLSRVDAAFLAFMGTADAALARRVHAARDASQALDAKAESALILEICPHLERFLSQLFGIADEVLTLAGRHEALDVVYRVKRQFVQRRAATKIKPADAMNIDGPALEGELAAMFHSRFDDLAFATHVESWSGDETAHADALDKALRYAAWALHTPAGRERHDAGLLFKQAVKIDPYRLLSHARQTDANGVTAFSIAPAHLRRRDAFHLTDQGTDLAGALDQANYCIWCHGQGKDSCSRGLREKPASDAPKTIVFKKSNFGVTLAGCPLEEKISEFHLAKSQGLALSALAIIAVDNPMVAATGHRICNDCMKACIYQKQQPVDIPQAETRTLKDVLELPWGFEIYSLLTRWNPLNFRRPLPLPSSGYRVLVAGMGPAGFSLAHYLMNDGHCVLGIDGLKIEPLPEEISGVGADGRRTAFKPIRDVSSLFESLNSRVMAGFGGVAEYGITVRWDKNFLKIIRLLLERRAQFAMIGGVRFGGTITLEDAWSLGFDHVALAMGAGKPTTLDIPNGLARGVRTASDFLMALQLTGAAKFDSIANVQMRLPAVVIGGGLTAIDTATESLAYYVVQVEKFLARFEALAHAIGEDALRDRWDAEEREIAEEFLSHGRAIRGERQRAARENRAARIIELLHAWGGVTVAYRRRLIDSPAYTLNHEEVEKALEEGITFIECLNPLSVETDEYGAARAIHFTRQKFVEDGKAQPDGDCRLPAHTIFVAAGTQPNTVLAREDEHHFSVDGKYFSACDEDGRPVKPQFSISKPRQPDVLLSRGGDGRFVSFFGDLHPSYFGNVVKALGSTKQGHPVVTRVLAKRPPADAAAGHAFLGDMNQRLRARIHDIKRLTPTIVEVIIHAPQAACNFRPGQFYRLQNFESLSPVVNGTRLQMEGLALTGAWVDRDRGLVSTIVLEMGGSSDLCAMLQPGEPVVLMGPTGTPTHIFPGETVILVGGGLGNAVLFSIGQAFRAAGSRVLYFAGYKKAQDRYKVEEIEAAADVIVWCCDEEPGFRTERPQDSTFIGNIVQAMEAYASGRLGEITLPMSQAARIVAIGSDRMMAAVARARHDVLAPYLKKGHAAIGSINSPMQCMLKEICAQCLQVHRDPLTGETRHVFSCFNQDQSLDLVDFHSLSERLRQNSLQEKLTVQWLKHHMPELKKQRDLV